MYGAQVSSYHLFIDSKIPQASLELLVICNEVGKVRGKPTAVPTAWHTMAPLDGRL